MNFNEKQRFAFPISLETELEKKKKKKIKKRRLGEERYIEHAPLCINSKWRLLNTQQRDNKRVTYFVEKLLLHLLE